MYNLKLIKTRKLKPLSQFNEMVTHCGLKLKLILNIYDAARKLVPKMYLKDLDAYPAPTASRERNLSL